MYVFRRVENSPTQMLYEMPAKAALAAIDGRHDQACHGVYFVPVTAREAHRWVKDDGLHATTLWVDGGKVRKA